MRTNVEMVNDQPQSELKKGDKGYIDGYVMGGDARPYAAVVCMDKGIVELVSTYNLKPTSLQ